MKVYSWSRLLLALAGAGLIGWNSMREFPEHRGLALMEGFLAVVVLLSGLRDSLTARGFQRAKEQERLTRRAEARLFGRYWPAVLWGGVAVSVPVLLLSLWKAEFFFFGFGVLGFVSMYYVVIFLVLGSVTNEIREEEAARGEGRDLD